MMVKRQRKESDPGEGSRKKSNSRIARACDRCQHRKLACDPTEHSCQQCQKAKTWCTMTDNLSGIPAYRGQYEYLERRVERQYQEIQRLLGRLRSLGQDVSSIDSQDNETVRYAAWKRARSIDPERPWEREDKQANLTRDLVIRDGPNSDPPSRRRSVRDDSLPSPELTPFGVFDFLAEPARPNRSPSIYSAPPQLPSNSPPAPIQQSRWTIPERISYSQPVSASYSINRRMSSTIQETFTHTNSGLESELDSTTTKSQYVIPNEDVNAKPVYHANHPEWYTYASGMDELQPYLTANSILISQSPNTYTLATTAERHPGLPANQDFGAM